MCCCMYITAHLYIHKQNCSVEWSMWERSEIILPACLIIIPLWTVCNRPGTAWLSVPGAKFQPDNQISTPAYAAIAYEASYDRLIEMERDFVVNFKYPEPAQKIKAQLDSGVKHCVCAHCSAGCYQYVRPNISENVLALCPHFG